MTNIRLCRKTIAAVGCGALILSLLAGAGVAGNKPPAGPAFWPGGTVPEAWDTFTGMWHIVVRWPAAEGADHYRVVLTAKGSYWYPKGFYWSQTTTGTNFTCRPDHPADVYRIFVTAYSGPDEATAYSETIQTRLDTAY